MYYLFSEKIVVIFMKKYLILLCFNSKKLENNE